MFCCSACLSWICYFSLSDDVFFKLDVCVQKKQLLEMSAHKIRVTPTEEKKRVLRLVKNVFLELKSTKDISVHPHFDTSINQVCDVSDLNGGDFNIRVVSVIRSIDVEALLKHLSSQLSGYNMVTRCQASTVGDVLNLYIIFRKKDKIFEFSKWMGKLLVYFFLFTLAVCIGRKTGLTLPIVI